MCENDIAKKMKKKRKEQKSTSRKYILKSYDSYHDDEDNDVHYTIQARVFFYNIFQ